MPPSWCRSQPGDSQYASQQPSYGSIRPPLWHPEWVLTPGWSCSRTSASRGAHGGQEQACRRQQGDSRGIHLSRSVHRPRPDVRSRVEHHQEDRPRLTAQLSDPALRPRLRLRVRPQCVASSLQPERPRPAADGQDEGDQRARPSSEHPTNRAHRRSSQRREHSCLSVAGRVLAFSQRGRRASASEEGELHQAQAAGRVALRDGATTGALALPVDRRA